MIDLDSRIRETSDSRIIESAVPILARRFGIDDPKSASHDIAATAGGGRLNPESLDAAARLAVQRNPKDIVDIFRLIILDIAQESAASNAEVSAKLEQSGKKAPFAIDDLLVIGAICLAGYIMHKTGGVSERTSTTVFEETEDGRIKITRKETIKYISPSSSVFALLKSLPDAPSNTTT